MTRVERRVPKGLSIHVILDNYATHKTPEVQDWLGRHPRVHFHFTPTSASWLNLVERFFSELTTRQLRRLAVTFRAPTGRGHPRLHRAPQPRSQAVHLDRVRSHDHEKGQEGQRDFGFTTLVFWRHTDSAELP